MTLKLLVLRPEPGASETSKRAAAMGLDPLLSPLFAIGPLDWTAPDAATFDAVVMTSANAARHGGSQLKLYRGLPVYAVGRATADAARAAGFLHVTAGEGGVADLIERLDPTHRRLLRLGGAHLTPAPAPGLTVCECAVYAATPAEALSPPAIAACRAGAVALLHSARAAALFGTLLDGAGVARGAVSILAISLEVAAATGPGWRHVAAAPRPHDAAMLAAARKLCENGAP